MAACRSATSAAADVRDPLADTDILFTNQLSRESKILYHRNISHRVQLLAPFLKFDADPYLVLSEGKLFWMQDAYTTTANYPYSTPTSYQGEPINYIRNSVKIVIDAYHGSTEFYMADPDDPIAQTLSKIFPGMLKPMAAMSVLSRELPSRRYPKTFQIKQG